MGYHLIRAFSGQKIWAAGTLAGGTCFEHLETRREDEAYLDALGVRDQTLPKRSSWARNDAQQAGEVRVDSRRPCRDLSQFIRLRHFNLSRH